MVSITLLIVAYLVNAYIVIFMICLIPVMMLPSRFFNKKLFDLQKHGIVKQDKYMRDMRYIIESKREINVLKKEQVFIDFFNKAEEEWSEFIVKLKYYSSLAESLPAICYKIYSVLYIVAGVYLIKNAVMTEGELVAGYQYIAFFTVPINRIASIIVRFKTNEEHINRVVSINCFDEDIDRDKYIKIRTSDKELINIKNINFYKDREKNEVLFSGDDIKIEDNGLYIIKGKNGSGKSILLNMVFGNISFDYFEGDISITKDIQDVSFLTYPHIFINGSFDSNIFNEHYDKKYLDILNINYKDKIIQTNPVNLSLGEQQKLALLRVLSNDSKYLLLDEPFTNLDVQTQKNIVDYVKEAKRDKCIVIISHETDFDDMADNIFVINDNKIKSV